MADEVIVVEEAEVAVPEEDATAKAQANAEAIIKDAQRKQTEAAHALQRAKQLEAEAQARYEATSAQENDDPIAEARKVISEEVRKILDEQNSKTQEQKIDEAVMDFRTSTGVSDIQLGAIFEHFEQESIVPQTPKALERALNKAYKELFVTDEDNTEALIAKLQKKGKVVQVTKKAPVTTQDTRPLSERKDLSWAEKRKLIWNKNEE
jgi:hypothetical protein